MNSFLKKILVFITIPSIVILVIIIVNYNSFPAPRISNNYSLNEKLFFFDNFNTKYLTIGSSIALNNIHSEELIAIIKHKNYLNLASWGMKMSDNYQLLEAYFQNNNPHIIFLASNIIDFNYSLIGLTKDQISKRILNPEIYFKPYFYLTNLDFRYYAKYLKLNKIWDYNNNIPESMKFDKYGGVMYANTNFQFDSIAYNTNLNNFDNEIVENYLYLDSICYLVARNQCKLVFIQTPTRPGLIDQTYLIKKKNHIQKVRSILKKHGHEFIDGSDIEWPDSLYEDYGHFKEEGARLFTNYTLSKLKTNYFE